ncbi:myc proto-oncogene protein [Saccoglossus kowalevskii]|uniref:Myc protein n=1 Tax=Saccoglossus kowalevskii TaxID=10224 RepID=B5THP1_SACKO|nr:myc proto-oncogene protein [Saccoglossus kowalevskii]ACH73249.1 myc protein [Saccoglossus kowalevskii]
MPEMEPEQRIQSILDYDKYQPYFLGHDENEEFYGATHTPSPSEDIWKKFELLPTPPRSPGRPAPIPLLSVVAEALQQVSETLDDDNHTQTFVFPDLSNLKSNLIQDCMWSGGNNGTPEETTKGETTLPAAIAACLTPPPLDYAVAECVDPTAVFPYPLNDPKDQLSGPSQSDSEEEIDVVTVAEKLQQPPKRKVTAPATPASNTATTTTNTTSSITLKRVRPSHNHHNHHSYSTPAKKTKQELSMAELKALMQQSNGGRRTPGNSRPGSRSSSRPSSDSEDNDKRATHNVLERKRRNDLKTSFLTLRDNVPELENQERAPKVVILRKATDHIQQITADELLLVKDKEGLKKRNVILLDKLNRLKNDLNFMLY